MSPLPDEPLEAEGVLNPGSVRGRDRELHLLPRLVAAGNVSRVGPARVIVTDGTPTGVDRRGVVLAPDRSWERGDDHSGVEDPRVTWIDALGGGGPPPVGWLVLQRSAEPPLTPETTEETDGIVANVMFPAAIEEVDGSLFVFYGMADTSIGTALITPLRPQ